MSAAALAILVELRRSELQEAARCRERARAGPGAWALPASALGVAATLPATDRADEGATHPRRGAGLSEE